MPVAKFKTRIGETNWVALLRLMADQHADLALVFIGSADEFDRSADLAAVWPGRTLNLCGRLAPRESAAAMQRAVLFVGHDSGPMHLAAATGVPCVAMFGNFNKPKWWHPAGKGHRIIHNMRAFGRFHRKTSMPRSVRRLRKHRRERRSDRRR